MENKTIAALNLAVRTDRCLKTLLGERVTVGDVVEELATNGWARISRINGFGRLSSRDLVEALEVAGFHAKHGWYGPTWASSNAPPKPPREKGLSIYLRESQMRELLMIAPPWFTEKLKAALPKVC